MSLPDNTIVSPGKLYLKNTALRLRINQARLNITAREAARQIGITRQHYSSITNEEVSRLQRETIRKIEDWLQLTKQEGE